MDSLRKKTDISRAGEKPISDAVKEAATAVVAAAGRISRHPLDSGGGMHTVAEALGTLSRAIAVQADYIPGIRPVGGTPPSPDGDAAFSHLRGLPEIRSAIEEAVDQAGQEILTAQPGGPRPEWALRGALDTVRDKLARDVAMRTLYQHSTRFDEPTKDYVRAVTEYGAQVRTLAEFFDRLIIIDQAVAFIPSNRERTSALLVREPAIVNFLADLFERAWDRAEPYPFLPVRAAEAAPEVIPAMRAAIRRLLIEGRSDKEISRRLGLSQRSLQAHVAHLKNEYGAQHRLQLGYLIALREERTPAQVGDRG